MEALMSFLAATCGLRWVDFSRDKEPSQLMIDVIVGPSSYAGGDRGSGNEERVCRILDGKSLSRCSSSSLFCFFDCTVKPTVHDHQGANTCSDNEPDSQRIIYGYFGVRDTLRQGETGILAAPPEVVRDMPPEVLRLIVRTALKEVMQVLTDGARVQGYYRSTSNLGGLRGKDPVDTYKPLAGYKEKWSSVQVA